MGPMDASVGGASTSSDHYLAPKGDPLAKRPCVISLLYQCYATRNL